MTVKPEDGYEIPVHLLDADDVPELTEDFFRNARPARELFAGLWGEEKAEAFLAESRRKRGQRGKQKAPVKRGVYLRVDADVLERFKASGPGWQTRMNQTLRQGMEQMGTHAGDPC